MYEPLLEAAIFQALRNICFATDSGDPSCISSFPPAKTPSGLIGSDNFRAQIKTFH